MGADAPHGCPTVDAIDIDSSPPVYPDTGLSNTKASSERVTASPAPSNSTPVIEVSALDLVGRTIEEATRILTSHGLAFLTVDAGNAPTENQVGRVAAASPQGFVEAGSSVTLATYGPMATMQPPPEPWVVYGQALAYEVPAGANLRVLTLRGEVCATNTGTPTAHTFRADYGRFANGEREITTSTPTADVAVPLTVDVNAAGQTLHVSVATTCTNSAGERVSDFSRRRP